MPRFILPMLMWLIGLPALADTAQPLQLLNYESPHHHELPLSGDDWQWLRNKRELVLGTSQQNLPPLEMVNEAKEYEGITADYVGLLADALGVKISVRAYDTREQVFNALAKGEIDFMGSVTQGEAEQRQLLRSQRYLINRPTLVARQGDSPSLKNGLQARRLAISLDTISPPVAQAMYPKARIDSYTSADAAMAAVAFGVVAIGLQLSARAASRRAATASASINSTPAMAVAHLPAIEAPAIHHSPAEREAIAASLPLVASLLQSCDKALDDMSMANTLAKASGESVENGKQRMMAASAEIERLGQELARAQADLDSLGKQVFPKHIHIHEDPFLPRGKGSSPFDDEGVRSAPRDVVADGKVEGYFLSSYSARKLGMKTTGNAGGSHNLTMTSRLTRATDDLDAMLRKLGTGLFVIELMGQGVNYVTGDYSRGASGFWVENGEIQFAVQEVTIAGNLRDMFKQIVAVGSDLELRSNIRTGSVLIERMTVAGS